MRRKAFRRFAGLAAAAVLSLGAVACDEESTEQDVRENTNVPDNVGGTEGPDPTPSD